MSAGASPTAAETARADNVTSAIRWSATAVAWSTVAGVVGLVAGLAAGAIALVGFGADSLVDGLASVVLLWSFGQERAGHPELHIVERRVTQVVGSILIVIGLYVGVSAIVDLAGQSKPSGTTAGVILTAVSIVVLPLLARAKLRLAAALDNPALRADGVLSLAGAALAAVTLIALGLDSAFGWWWSDAVAALAIAATLLREGFNTAADATQADSGRSSGRSSSA